MDEQKKPLIAFTGGGTGGHVFPALAVREEMVRLGWKNICWIGSTRGMEKEWVEKAGIPYYGVPAGKLRRYFSWQNFRDLFRVFAGFLRSLSLLKRLKPRVLFSKGGFVSVAPVLAARFLRIPVVTHESDVTPGLATRINGRSARRICIPYEGCRRYYPARLQNKLLVTGNPVRPIFRQASAEKGRRLLGIRPGRRVLVVFGGSQGALQINQLLEPLLPGLLEKWDVVHQMGADLYRPSDREGYHPAPFYGEEFPHILAAADLVISRAGAGSLSEMAALGKPGLLIPLSGASSRGDQVLNAEIFTGAGAAVVLEGRREGEPPDAEDLRGLLQDLMEDDEKLKLMGEKSRGLGRLDSAEAVARDIITLEEDTL